MNMNLLESILTAYGATSREGCVREVIKSAIVDCVDSMTTDAMGNLIAVKKGSGAGKRIMVSFCNLSYKSFAIFCKCNNGRSCSCAFCVCYNNRLAAFHNCYT